MVNKSKLIARAFVVEHIKPPPNAFSKGSSVLSTLRSFHICFEFIRLSQEIIRKGYCNDICNKRSPQQSLR